MAAALLLPEGAVSSDGDARTGRFHCEDCGLFLKVSPSYTEYECGVDAEYEFGTFGDVIRSGWETMTEVRECKSCGYHNKREGDMRDYR